MADGDFDSVIRQADPDRWLSSRFIADPIARSDALALYAYDQELGRAGRVTSNDLLAEIRLTWWREALDEIYGGRAVRFHPAAAALADVVRRRSLPREPLEAMIEGRIGVLGAPELSVDEALRWSTHVCGSAAAVAGIILDDKAPALVTAAAGALWGLSTLARAKRVDRQIAADHIAAEMPRVNRALKQLSPAAFPAVAHATLARGLARPVPPGPLAARARMILAVTIGRL